MLSRFDSINERQGIPYQTAPLRPDDVEPVARVCAALAQDFLAGPEWIFTPHEGCVSFHQSRESRRMARVFVDQGAALARRLHGERAPAGNVRDLAGGDPVVVAFNLSDEIPFMREQVRAWLRREFSEQYVDPTHGGQKIWIQPDLDVYYDILILPRGQCAGDATLTARYREDIEQMLAEVAERRTRRTA